MFKCDVLSVNHGHLVNRGRNTQYGVCVCTFVALSSVCTFVVLDAACQNVYLIPSYTTSFSRITISLPPSLSQAFTKSLSLSLS